MSTKILHSPTLGDVTYCNKLGKWYNGSWDGTAYNGCGGPSKSWCPLKESIETESKCIMKCNTPEDGGICPSGKILPPDKTECGTSCESKNGRCGPSHGKTYCPKGQCCSKFGWCGDKGSAHCNSANGFDGFYDADPFHKGAKITPYIAGLRKCGCSICIDNDDPKCIDNITKQVFKTGKPTYKCLSKELDDITANSLEECLINFPLKDYKIGKIGGVTYKKNEKKCIYYDHSDPSNTEFRNKYTSDNYETRYGPFIMGYLKKGTLGGHTIPGNSLDNCIQQLDDPKIWDKLGIDKVSAVGHRTIHHNTPKYKNTCFYYKDGVDLKNINYDKNRNLNGTGRHILSYISKSKPKSFLPVESISNEFYLSINTGNKDNFITYDETNHVIGFSTEKPSERHWTVDNNILIWKKSANISIDSFKITPESDPFKLHLIKVLDKDGDNVNKAYALVTEESFKTPKKHFKCLIIGNSGKEKKFSLMNWGGSGQSMCGLKHTGEDKVLNVHISDGLPNFQGIFHQEDFVGYTKQNNQVEHFSECIDYVKYKPLNPAVLDGKQYFHLYLLRCHGNEILSGDIENGYRGCQNKTESGKICQAWSSQTPHKHNNTPSNKSDKGIGNHNYCRNPDGEPDGIWCYTIDKDKRWEYCDPTMTPEEAGKEANSNTKLYLVCDENFKLSLQETIPKGGNSGIWNIINKNGNNVLQWNRNKWNETPSKIKSTLFNMGSITDQELSLISITKKQGTDPFTHNTNNSGHEGYAVVSKNEKEGCIDNDNNFKCLNRGKSNELVLEHGDPQIGYCGGIDQIVMDGMSEGSGIFMLEKSGVDYKTPTKPTVPTEATCFKLDGTKCEDFVGNTIIEGFEEFESLKDKFTKSKNTDYANLFTNAQQGEFNLFWNGYIQSHYEDNTTNAINNYETKINLKELLKTQNKVLQDRKDEANKLVDSNSTTKRKIEINMNEKKFKNFRTTRLRYILVAVVILTIFPILAKFNLLPKNVVMIILAVVLLLILIYLFFAFYIQERNKDDNYFNERNFVKPTDHEIARSKTMLDLSNKDKERCAALAELGEDLDPANFVIPDTVMDGYISTTSAGRKCNT
jgi:hypothetical protein